MSDARASKVNVLNLADDAPGDPGAATLRCKFVLIEHGGELHFVFAPTSHYPYHANLIARYCDLYRVSSSWEHKPDLYAVHDAAVRVRGGGRLTLDFAEQRAEIYGCSTAYGASDPDLLAIVVGDREFFTGWRVVQSTER